MRTCVADQAGSTVCILGPCARVHVYGSIRPVRLPSCYSTQQTSKYRCTDQDCLSNYVVLSHTQTLSALMNAQSAATTDGPQSDSNVLVVSVPNARVRRLSICLTCEQKPIVFEISSPRLV
jgi:hypothetical protein